MQIYVDAGRQESYTASRIMVSMSGDEIDINEAITLYLKHYPGKNTHAFASYFGPALTLAAEDRVRSILDEAMSIKHDWSSMSLNEAGDYVESVMRDRHPELAFNPLCISAIILPI